MRQGRHLVFGITSDMIVTTYDRRISLRGGLVESMAET